MNRERLLFVFVLAIVALWFFVLREPVQPERQVRAGETKIEPLPVRSAAHVARPLTLPDLEPFELLTNESPHAREDLPLVRAYDLPNAWPPTSRSVSRNRLGRLRRPAAGPAEGEATLALPDLEPAAGAGEAGGAPGAPAEDRVDQWSSFNRVTSGRVLGLVVDGKLLRDPRETPKVGEIPPYHRLLILVETDPQRAQQEGVRELQMKFDVGGVVRQNFPAEVTNVTIAIRGRHKSWWDGAKAYLGLPEEGFERRIAVGRRLLDQGRETNDPVLLEWALTILREAKEKVPSANQSKLREILESMLATARLLNRQEQVLELGFEHLSRFPQEDTVLLFIGDILASRSFGLLEQAVTCYERAASNREAQRHRAGLLIRLDRYEEARRLLESGAAGTGPEVDLLLARAALAQADFETASTRASRHTGGDSAVEAHLILGGAFYAQGDAARAEEEFLAALSGDPRRSQAYSDLGLALAVQGRVADAMACFERALPLDFENSVAPRLGEAFLKLAAGDAAGEAGRADYEAAEQLLAKLSDDNPRDLLVRYYLSYAKEKLGDLEAAAVGYRSVIDDDHRYRLAIARLGLVLARRAAAPGAGEELVLPAVAHLGKAVDLNPAEPVLPYILARFLTRQKLQPLRADKLFASAQTMASPPHAPDLALWAEAGRAALLYRDETQDELTVKSRFLALMNAVQERITRTGVQDIQRALDAHPVYAYGKTCLELVTENERKVDVVWRFKTEPRDWNFRRIEPMRVGVPRSREGLHFQGTVNFHGESRTDYENILKYCAAEYADAKLTGSAFYELRVRGVIPEGTTVDVGVGLVTSGGRRREGPAGVQIRRKARTGTAELRLDGADNEPFKSMKARSFIEMTKVPWPAGEFEIVIRLRDKDSGTFELLLNGTNVLEAQIGEETDKCAIFGRGRGSRQIAVVLWVEGNDGEKFEGIYIDNVTLTREGAETRGG